MVKAEAKEDLCNIIQDRGRGELCTVLDHGEILHGTVQRHTSLLHFVPVTGGDSVVDRQRGGAGEAAELLQATHSHVGEAKPVSHTELRQQAALHHLVQLVQ